MLQGMHALLLSSGESQKNELDKTHAEEVGFAKTSAWRAP